MVRVLHESHITCLTNLTAHDNYLSGSMIWFANDGKSVTRLVDCIIIPEIVEVIPFKLTSIESDENFIEVNDKSDIRDILNTAAQTGYIKLIEGFIGHGESTNLHRISRYNDNVPDSEYRYSINPTVYGESIKILGPFKKSGGD